MNPVVAKQQHFESYRVSMSREPTGKARRS